MRVDTFSYALPPERIAQHPTRDREDARLMVLSKNASPEDRTIRDLADLLPTDALLVVNDTRVIPARLLGHKKDTGGKVEIFLVRAVGKRTLRVAEDDVRDASIWQVMGKASKPLHLESDIHVGPILVRVLAHADGVSTGLYEVALSVKEGSLADALRAHGHVPLPPYIKRDDEPADRERYQTVFARTDGAVAAPTAGLHLSHGLIARLASRGCEIASVTLHVGLGTFQPVAVEDLDDHPMHAEWFEVPAATAAAIARARARKAPVVAIGTTVVRALESAAHGDGVSATSLRETRLLIQPGYAFRVVDLLLTNFHLPRSTLLAMVCAFGGTARVLSAYESAVARGYRFFSYGDAMLLSPKDEA